jgi:diguanylate cyclase (GGDEF)-like protein
VTHLKSAAATDQSAEPASTAGLTRLLATAAQIADPLLCLASHPASYPVSGLASGAVLDAGGPRVVWANAAAQELLRRDQAELAGCTVEELLGLPRTTFTTLVTPGAAAAERARPGQNSSQHSDRAATADPSLWRDTLLTGPDGVRRPARLRISAVEYDGRRGWAVALHTITDVEASVTAARAEAEHWIRAVAEHAPIGIILSEAGIRLGFVNTAFAALLDRPAPALRGQGWLAGIHPADLPTLQTALAQVLTGQPAEATVRVVPDLPGHSDPDGSDQGGSVRRTSSGAEGREPASGGGGPTSGHRGVGSRWVQFQLVPVTTPRRAAGFVATVEDVTDRRARDSALTYQAYHDPLTGLANRRRLVETLTDLLDSHRGPDRDFAVLFCDLNGFKQVNDAHGHETGDQLLIEIARILAGTARAHDLVARLAGDEFVVLLTRVRDDTEAAAAAARYQSALTTIIRAGALRLPVSATVGVARPRPGDTPTTLLAAADQTMYQAKRRRAGLRSGPASQDAVMSNARRPDS